MKAHKFASYFPAMPEDEFKELVEDIKQNGLIEPITLYEGAILDGMHRYRACEIAGVEPRYQNWTDTNPLRWVISKNLMRRHLSKGQRVTVLIDAGLLAKEMEPGERTDLTSRNSERLTQQEAAELAGTHTDLVRQVQEVASKDEALADEIRKGDISPNLAHMMVKVKERGKQYGMEKEAESLVKSMQEDRIGHNAVRDLLGAMTVAWEADDKARVKELFLVDDPSKRTTSEQEKERQASRKIEQQVKEIEETVKKGKTHYEALPEVKWILDYIKTWSEALTEWHATMVKMSPEAMRFTAMRIRKFVVKLNELAEELEEKGAVNV